MYNSKKQIEKGFRTYEAPVTSVLMSYTDVLAASEDGVSLGELDEVTETW